MSNQDLKWFDLPKLNLTVVSNEDYDYSCPVLSSAQYKPGSLQGVCDDGEYEDN